ncbi:SMI1/KNR4 family protein [Guptibacillus sedimenti]|uniref:SMI1/KNR4 family protein n=1 Tax=Guptibacillus sedimenti TaxID=3025680 RepID=UPI002362DF95|nr:SMI1/KNR4 family protein [Pseudalkalibacillus sedimenti]
MEKISFLSQYRKEVKLVNVKKLENGLKETIPKQWLEIISEEDKNLRVEKTLELWKSLFNKELSNSILYLSANLIDVELIVDNGIFTILYSIHDPQGNYMYYEGGLPGQNIKNSNLRPFWEDTPDKLRSFYEKLHDGFYYFPSRAMGLVSLSDATFFEDDEWGIIDELEEPIKINLRKTFGFFENGMGGYLAVDLENCKNDNATLWFTDDQPEYEVNFWDVADEWLLIGFEE